MIALLLASQELLVLVRPEKGLRMAGRLLLLDVLSSIGVQDLRVEHKFLRAVGQRIVLQVASLSVHGLLVVGGRGVLLEYEILLIRLDLFCVQLSRPSVLLLVALVAVNRSHVVERLLQHLRLLVGRVEVLLGIGLLDRRACSLLQAAAWIVVPRRRQALLVVEARYLRRVGVEHHEVILRDVGLQIGLLRRRNRSCNPCWVIVLI